MDNEFDPSNLSTNFEHICYVPNYRALQIIQEQKSKINQLLSNNDCDIILKKIAQESSLQFRNSLKDVEQFIRQNSSIAVKKLNQERAKFLANELKTNFSLSSTEIVMILNEMPKDESFVELMFPGKFTKDQSFLLSKLIEQYGQLDDIVDDDDDEKCNQTN